MMKKIGGNISAQIQINAPVKNEIGETVKKWATVQTLTGFLDYSSGESLYTNYQAKVQDSTHVFVCDYTLLDSRIMTENARMVINGGIYDVLLIDNPMELNYQYEFYLRYTGGRV